jgi:hypothetical protein
MDPWNVIKMYVCMNTVLGYAILLQPIIFVYYKGAWIRNSTE